MKLEFQNIIEFIGRIEDSNKWKSITECAFNGSCCNWVLYDSLFEAKNQQINWILYSHISVSTVGGTEYYLVKRFEDTKDGNDAWK